MMDRLVVRAMLPALLLGVLVACTQVRNPATGEVQYTSLDPQEEAALGRAEHPKVLAEFGGAYDDPALQRYVEGVGSRLVAVSELSGNTFTFTILDSDIVNAFALPGGYVYISRGLLALAENEAQLAGVLAHEIGHVTARHTAQRYDRAQQASLGAAAAQIGGAILGGMLGGQGGAQVGGQLAGQAGQLGGTAYVQGFSREQEYQADELGVRYLARAGYDPQAMATFLDQLDEESSLRRELAGGQASEAPNWLSSHPRAVDRVERAAVAAEGQFGGQELGRDRYLAQIDGLVFGESPAQGYVREEGRMFIHPGLRFEFIAPSGFKLRNTPAAVIGTDGSGNFMVFDMAQARTSDMRTYIEREWISRTPVTNLQRIEVDGRDAAVGFAQATVDGRQTTVMLAAVPGDGNGVFRFVFGGGPLGSNEVRRYEASLRSFDRLSAAEAASYAPLRIDIVTVQPGDTISSLAARMKLPTARTAWFRVLNDLDDRRVAAGHQVKLVR